MISVPGSYSEVDASGLEVIGLGATGIVAMLGNAEGGRPISDITNPDDLLRLRKPQDVRDAFRSGDLREAGGILFEPAKDEIILAGAQEIIVCKTNPATKGLASFANAQGAAMDVTSRDFGAFVNQINVSIAAGTNNGKLISIIFEDITEAFDDVGGTSIFTLEYAVGTDTWDTMTGSIDAAGSVSAAATRAEVGKDTDVTALLADGAVRVVSASAGDTTQKVTVYGLAAGGVPVSETLTLNGTTPVDGVQVFAAGDVLGAVILGTTAGIVTVSDQVIPTTIMTIAAGIDQSQGLVVGDAMFVANSVAQGVLDAAGTGGDTSEVAAVDFFRLDSDGQWFKIASIVTNVSVTITNPDGLTIPSGATARSVTKSVPTWSELTAVVLGDIPSARTLTVSATAATTDALVQKTVQQASDFYNAKSKVITGPATIGFIFTIDTSSLSFLMANMDVTTGPSSLVGGGGFGFLADLFAVIDAINVNSQLLTATVASGATGGAPDDTSTPVFLTGGSEGVTTFQQFQDALNLLKQVRVNTIVTTSGDPSVHAAIEAHNAFMGGVGRSERDGKAGALNAGLTDVPTKTEFKQQALDLNSRHMQLVGQAITRFDSTGVRKEFLPPFAACLAAGMQAGSAVGTALTHKFANVLGFRQDSSWNPADDAEELIQAGLLFLENVDGQGRRWVRGVTTHLTSNNLAFTEASVNEAANFAAFNFRTAMEFFVGQNGFSGTVNAARGLAINQLGLQVDAGALVGTQALAIDIVLDVLEISVQIAPVIPINFVTTVLHLVTAQQLAA